jgi:hypothetical protein
VPFTPFHFGPGALAKSVAPRWFSFRAFVLSQIVIDCETAWNIYRVHVRLHTFFHSYLGVLAAILFGGWSQVFLDSVMHTDMRPLAPLMNNNAMFDLISVKALHMACLWSLVGAGLVWGLRSAYRRIREKSMH